MAEFTQTLADGTTVTYVPSTTSPSGYKRIITPAVKPKHKGLFGSKTKVTASPMGMAIPTATSGGGAAASHSMFSGLQGYGGGAVANPPAAVAGTMFAPSALPVKKKGLFASTKVTTLPSRPLPNPDQPPQPVKSSYFSTSGSTQPRLLPSLIPPQATADPAATFLTQPHSVPANYQHLSKAERKYYASLQKEQAKTMKAMQKAELARHKAERKDTERLAKLEVQRQKHAQKMELRQLKDWQKHPHRPRPLPNVYTGGQTATWDPKPNPIPAAAAPAKPAASNQPGYTFMKLPTLEEFGVRRPLNAPGQPGVGQQQWPMMSRTMAMALVEEERDQQLKMAGRGQIYGFW